ncbi:hypothetical protein SAMN04487857_102454 [Pseudomonas sp. ok272]|uniref:hypothetical protein n=1 Tax=unclassified Pseudomonas TaxID=196821 RepID=UPI0008C2C7AB|nr:MULTISPECIES: hypothetical protein [unclassified Pseudomonas]SEM52707.1 hypothetical protein SAMN04487857_102454 [Pseudomonas sp. ok272]SFM24646.1 hypothetical protein SAMN04487858_101456 [Pseudomonas sp. ok602]
MHRIVRAATICVLTLLAGIEAQGASLSLFSDTPEKLPAEFADYKDLADITDVDNYTVEKFNLAPSSTVEHSINKANNRVIIKATATINDHTKRYTFYKLDTSGKIVDTYQFTRNLLIAQSTGDEQLVDGVFLVNKEHTYYTTWPLDGDKTRKPLIALNQDLAWSPEKLDEFYADLVKKSTRLDQFTVYEAISPTENKRRVRKVFYLNSTGKWYVLYGNTLKSDYTGKQLPIFNTLFTDFTETERYFGRYVPPANIRIAYFEKITYKKFESSGGSNNNAAHMNYLWQGMGYYQVDLGNSTLKFKNKGTLSRTDFKGEDFPPKESLLVDFAYYSNPHLNYALFSANDTLYLIKRK